MSDRGNFIIKIKHGGLGDHLFHSHLPRIAKEAGGFEKVLISNQSEFRNPDYRRLVWELNPFVDGYTDEDAPFPGFDTVPAGTNLMDEIMIRRGLDDGRRMHEPEVFYKPAVRADVVGKSVYDPNFVSNVGTVSAHDIDRYFRRNGIEPDFMLKLRTGGLGIRRYGAQVETADVFDYCAVIVSCARFFCLTSGGATLAAALGKGAVAFYGEGQPTMYHHSRQHTYVRAGRFPLPKRLKIRCRTKAGRVLRQLGIRRDSI